MTAVTHDRILRLKAVLERTGLSRSAIYRQMRDGTFPKNLTISKRATGWRESSIDAWIRGLAINTSIGEG